MRKKNFLALLLTLIIIISQIPVGVFAQSVEEYEGLTEEDEEPDFEPSPFNIIAELTEEGYHKLSWDWNGTARRVKFKIYGAPLGGKYRKIAVVNGPELSYINKIIDDKIWKYYVVPVLYLEDGTRQKLDRSVTSFLVSKENTKYTNATSIEINDLYEIWIQKGTEYSFSVTLTREAEDRKLYSSKKNPKIRYFSSNDSVATVHDGIITAVSEGWCYIDVVSENGLDNYITVYVLEPVQNPQIDYSFATKEEGIEYLMSNKEYYEGFSQYDLDYRMKKKGATLEEYIEYAKKQTLDFTDREKELIDYNMWLLEKRLEIKGMTLPAHEPIVFVKTTMGEEGGDAYAYTHGGEIFLGDAFFQFAESPQPEYEAPAITVFHEVFHCLTRNNPEFRKDMYEIINFTVQDEDYVIPPSVKERFFSNPDVEHHNAYATFNINGEDIKCFMAVVVIDPSGIEKFYYDNTTPVLVPVDGTDTCYLPEDALNFYDVFGENTDYDWDPEECMAVNFAYAVYDPYDRLLEAPTPEILIAIYDYLTK